MNAENNSAIVYITDYGQYDKIRWQYEVNWRLSVQNKASQSS